MPCRPCPLSVSLADHTASVCFQPSQKGQLRFHQLQNVQVALDFLHFRKVSLSARLAGGVRSRGVLHRRLAASPDTAGRLL